MMAPASDAIAAKFGETNPTVVALFTSVFVCGFGVSLLPPLPSEGGDSPALDLLILSRDVAFGPLVLGPLSEVFGRARVLQGANLWYLRKSRMGYMRSLLAASNIHVPPCCSVEPGLRLCSK